MDEDILTKSAVSQEITISLLTRNVIPIGIDRLHRVHRGLWASAHREVNINVVMTSKCKHAVRLYVTE